MCVCVCGVCMVQHVYILQFKSIFSRSLSMAIKQNRYVFRQKRQRRNTVFASCSNISHSSLLIRTARFQCTANILARSHTHIRPKHFIFLFFIFTHTKQPNTENTFANDENRADGRRGLNIKQKILFHLYGICASLKTQERQKQH